MHGGEIVAEVLARHRVPFVFTLTGGHISPILVACHKRDIRVIDVRHEVNAVFAADGVSRLTGVPGVAVVTAGPGVANTVTAVKNAQLAQSALVVIGGATATLLKGRGALQDIDQMRLMRPHVKWAASVTRFKDLGPVIDRALSVSRKGVPGPVFVEAPVDILYPEGIVREWYFGKAGGAGGLSQRLFNAYLGWHLRRQFAGSAVIPQPASDAQPAVEHRVVRRAVSALHQAQRPLLLVGSQAVNRPADNAALISAIERLRIPVYLTGMARGLLGQDHPLQRRHNRREALREADLVMLAGVPCDFRLDYGRQISRRAKLIAVNLDGSDLRRNRRPDIGTQGHPGAFITTLGEAAALADRPDWLAALDARDVAREAEIDSADNELLEGGPADAVQLCRAIDRQLSDNSIIVADGGDFIGTAAYIVRPRRPLSWLDPGPFGTLGIGAGFALAAKLCRPDADVWLLYGDGSVGFSLSEFDTFSRHGLPVISVVGNDGAWSQIAREQVSMLGDPVGTQLGRADYHLAVEGMGAKGFLLDRGGDAAQVLDLARRTAAEGRSVLVNAHLTESNFRAGAISI